MKLNHIYGYFCWVGHGLSVSFYFVSFLRFGADFEDPSLRVESYSSCFVSLV